jgi:hypothetical protein
MKIKGEVHMAHPQLKTINLTSLNIKKGQITPKLAKRKFDSCFSL